MKKLAAQREVHDVISFAGHQAAYVLFGLSFAQSLKVWRFSLTRQYVLTFYFWGLWFDQKKPVQSLKAFAKLDIKIR